MKYTNNLNLKKPEGTDTVNIDDFNENFDKIDSEIIKKATNSADGRMSKEDKVKLDGIEAGAEKNKVTSVAGKTGAVTVSKSDVGLDSVPNYSVASQAEAEAGTVTNKLMTPQRVKQAIDKLAPKPPVTSVAGKTGAVTLSKNDVGLNNVDNVKQASKTEFDTHKADYTQFISGIQQLAIFKPSVNQSISSTDGSSFSLINLNSTLLSVEFATLENGKIKILKDGLYKIDAYVAFNTNGSGVRSLSIGPKYNTHIRQAASPTGLTIIHSSKQMIYKTGDYIELSVSQSSGTALDVISGWTQIFVTRLGE